MIRIPRASTRKHGFTILEAVLAGTLTVGLFGSMVMSMNMAWSTYRETQAEDELSQQVHRVLTQITDELQDAAEGDFAGLVPGAPTITFRPCVGYDAGAQLWGDVRTIACVLADGELDDGVDNNQNGLVDEQVVRLTENPGVLNQEREVILTGFVRELAVGEIEANGADDNGSGLVDDEGLAFSITGGVLTVWLTLERVGPGGRLLTKTGQGSVRLVN